MFGVAVLVTVLLTTAPGNVVVVTSEFLEANPERYQGRWVETFFDTEGKTYAGVGFTYDETTRDFISPVLPELPVDSE